MPFSPIRVDWSSAWSAMRTLTPNLQLMKSGRMTDCLQSVLMTSGALMP